MNSWVVERAIPNELVSGIVTGEYTLHGGVVRNQAGQIVRHLINTNPAQLEEVLQSTTLSALNPMSATAEQILQLATNTMFLSQLNLTVSFLNFYNLNKKLNRVEHLLSETKQEVQDIKSFLTLQENARLKAALADLLKINYASDLNRHDLLHNIRHILQTVNYKYRELFETTETIEAIKIYDNYLTITGLTQVRCTAELGMLEMAHHEMTELQTFWSQQSHRLAKDVLLGENPERFLYGDLADIPISEVTQWLDFAHQTEKGFMWVDELRSQNKPWYPQRGVSLPSVNFKNKGVVKDKEYVRPTMQCLIAKDAVLKGYTAQYQFLLENELTPSQFEQDITNLIPNNSIDGYLILKPSTIKRVSPSKKLDSVKRHKREKTESALMTDT